MQYAKINTFIKHYLRRIVTANTRAIVSGYSDISNNRLNRILSEGQEGREKGREHQNHEIIFYDFSITIALIEMLIGLN